MNLMCYYEQKEVSILNVDYQLIGKRIKELRKSKRITQEMLAEMLDISVSYISRIERGIVKISLETLVKTAAALDMPPSYFLDGIYTKTSAYLNDDLAEITKHFSAGKMKLLSEIAKNIREY